MERKLLDYNVDCEYNKNLDRPKNFDGGIFSKYSDIIIHKRGFNDLHDNDRNNLLLIEFKPYDVIPIDAFVVIDIEFLIQNWSFCYSIFDPVEVQLHLLISN